MGKAFNYERAEQEANKIGLEFAHSNDVVKDMSRAYDVDFSNIRVHTDSTADNKVKAAGKDALAQGNDIFFGKGIFESDHPAAKSLVAHEFAHTMQQGAAMGGEMAVAESAPMGAAQGGLGSWFKGLFKRKPAKPTLLDDGHMDEADFGHRFHDGPEKHLRFMSTQSRAIYEMTKNASPEMLREDPMLRQLILNDYKTSMAQRLQHFEGDTYDGMFSKVFRSNSPGEMKTYNMLLKAAMPENISKNIAENFNGSNVDELLDSAGGQIMNDPVMMEILQANMEALSASKHFSGENEGRRSEMSMNSAMLRAIAPDVAMKHGNKAASVAMQRAVNGVAGNQTEGSRRFLSLLRRRG